MSKRDARKELQELLVDAKSALKKATDFADENQLEFHFMGFKYILRCPWNSRLFAKTGMFISESEWQSSSWGCEESDSHEEYCRWSEENFPPEE